MRTRSLLNQVLAVNAALVAVTALIATLLNANDIRGALLVGIAVVSAVMPTRNALTARTWVRSVVRARMGTETAACIAYIGTNRPRAEGVETPSRVAILREVLKADRDSREDRA